MSGRRYRGLVVGAVALVLGTLAPPAADAAPQQAQPSSDGISAVVLRGSDGAALRAAREINERGQVLAWDERSYFGYMGATVWRNGVATRLVTWDGSIPSAADLSETGGVVGERVRPVPPATSTNEPFLWRGGRFRPLPPGEGHRVPVAVDDDGTVLASPNQARLGTVVWDRGQVAEAPITAAAVEPIDLNNRGQVLVNVVPDRAGDWYSPRHPALWEVGGGVTELGTLGGARAKGLAINERGAVAGVSQTATGEDHAFLWDDGEITDLGTLGGASSMVGTGATYLGVNLPFELRGGATPSERNALNEQGYVVGQSTTPSGAWHAFLWRDGRMIDLGTLGGTHSRAYAVNSWGQVVGISLTASGETHGFLWHEGRMTDLGPAIGSPGSFANDINDRGQIVGGEISDSIRAVLWTVPVPSNEG